MQDYQDAQLPMGRFPLIRLVTKRLSSTLVRYLCLEKKNPTKFGPLNTCDPPPLEPRDIELPARLSYNLSRLSSGRKW